MCNTNASFWCQSKTGNARSIAQDARPEDLVAYLSLELMPKHNFDLYLWASALVSHAFELSYFKNIGRYIMYFYFGLDRGLKQYISMVANFR